MIFNSMMHHAFLPTNDMNSMKLNPPRTLQLRRAACALSIALAYPIAAYAQPLAAIPAVPDGRSQFSAPVAIGVSKVAQIVVQLSQNGLPADGQSAVQVSLQLLDAKGQPVLDSELVTLEASAGRILLAGAATDTLGPEGGDADKVTPGVQLKVERGVANFRLLAPTTPQEVLLRVSSGNIQAQGQVSFAPEMREMLAVGLIEGIIAKRNLTSDALAPSRFNDGFEQEITRWSRQFNQGKANVSARTAFFLKGKISGDKLLTAAYDSDKATRSRLQRDIDPNAFYPVYGDSASTGFDARSSERLYVRIDQDKSYLLYGDFATGEGFASSVPGPNQGLAARKLGQYNRSVTGLRGHWQTKGQDSQGQFGGFVVHDNLKQAIEEYQANGTSGPFAVRSNNALTNSERVEIIVRDKNQLERIKQVTPLARLDDYSFEPFSGRILFKQAVAALTPDGDPQSVRISYEVEQGGEKFWVLGLDGQWQFSQHFTLGGVIVEDKNPQAPYQLQSINAQWQLSSGTRANTRIVAEVAHSNGLNNLATSNAAPNLTQRDSGNAVRVEMQHSAEKLSANLSWQKADIGFNNSAAGISAGHSDLQLKASVELSKETSLYGKAVRSRESLQAAKRDAAQLGVQHSLSEKLTLDISLQTMREEGAISPSALAPNSATGTIGGGFFGFGLKPSAVDTSTGNMSNFTQNNAPANATNATNSSNTTSRLDANTLAIGLRYQATSRWQLSALAEHSISGAEQQRYEIGTKYQLSERSRAYARYESQTGLASRYALNPSEKSHALIAGVESSYLPGASIFTEYRLRDALATDTANARDMQLASGLRNTWNVAEGLAANTNLEYLHVFQGAQQKGVAASIGVDYTANALWKASAKLEFRRLFDSAQYVGNQSQDQWLSTLSIARKLNRDWTLLARNYLLFTRNHDNISGAPQGNNLQERAQLGVAWRPVDDNRVNGLARYEYKNVRTEGQATFEALGDNYYAHIVSAHLDYHPARPWWFSSRVAAKSTVERNLPSGQQKYNAWLLGGRVVYDISENWDISVLANYLHSPQGHTSQWARGVEAGYLLKENLWLSLGYNASGFSERDMNNADYTAKGIYLRLRFKFDENLFKGNDAQINRSLPR